MKMPNYVEEPPSLKERFDALESLVNTVWDHVQGVITSQADNETQRRQDHEENHADLKVLKKAVGCILLGLAGQPVNIGSDLLESLGFKTSSIVPASAIVKPS